MIEYVSAKFHYNVTIGYSTPSQYIKAISEQNLEWPTRYFDMFPYADVPEDYWTGYFSSRPNSKKFIRDGSANFHASNKYYSAKVIDQKSTDQEIEDALVMRLVMQDALGVSQHHDAITGTEK